jgi:hypothetical protein
MKQLANKHDMNITFQEGASAAEMSAHPSPRSFCLLPMPLAERASFR